MQFGERHSTDDPLEPEFLRVPRSIRRCMRRFAQRKRISIAEAYRRHLLAVMVASREIDLDQADDD